MMSWRHRIGEWLRALARRIDPCDVGLPVDADDDDVYGVPGGLG